MIRLLVFLHDNWVGVILLMTLLVFLAWLMGYLLNGFYGYKFDLQSCWAGFGAIATAAGAGWGKWFVDSKLNSIAGEMPSRKDVM